MGYKLGIGLLLFGILLSNGSVLDYGGYFFLAGLLFGFIGLILIIAAHVREKKHIFQTEHLINMNKIMHLCKTT